MRALAWIASLALLAPAALADERGEHLYLRQLGADTFVAGESARHSAPVQGDLIAAGGELLLAGPVAGDQIAFGGKLRLDGAVSQDLYAGGGQVALDGSVARNARVAGGEVSLGPRARVAGNASLAGGDVKVLGTIDGYLQAAGGRVLIDGRVAGDVEAASGALELGPNARIGGKLRYRGGAPLKQDPAAQVQGGIERLEMPMRDVAERSPAPAVFGVWTLGLMVMAAVLVLALPGFFGRVAQAARTRFGWSLLAGFLALAAIPLAAVILLASVIGIPLALVALLGYLMLLLVGYVAAGIALGDATLARGWAARAAHRGWRALFAALGVLVIGIVALIPWLGALAALAALITGMGALLLQARAPG
ncbi:MAG: polymer-forming cytoskeletal protein [Betaproteobacteria bacterium]|nr:polymer-forming cytoskeletal protein [Betaproteobacteria bacterium]